MKSQPDPARPLRVVHVITSLQTGGAEAMLAKLVAGLDASRCESFVVCLGRDGLMGTRIRAAGVPVFALSVGLRWSLLRDVSMLIGRVRRWRPTHLQGWMYHGNLAALLLRWLTSRRSFLIWNIRCTLTTLIDFPLLTRWVIQLNALFSRSPDLVIFNSRAAIADHLSRRFRPRRTLVLPNGFDLDRFSPSRQIWEEMRRQFRVAEHCVVIGMVARYHPMKDFPNFIRAMRMVAENGSEVAMVLAGPGVDERNKELVGLVDAHGLSSITRYSGECPDVSRLLPAFDILCLSSSWGEAFPNILGEAMSCAVPCVTTDVGDAEEIVADCGVVVERRNSEALGKAIEKLVEMRADARSALGVRGRKRVAERYNIRRIVEDYLETYADLAYEKRR